MPPRKYMVNASSSPMDTFTKNGSPVWKSVRPIQYIMSENANERKSLFLKVAPSDLSISEFDGTVSTKSFSLRKKVGISIQIAAIAASTMKQIL